ncbi:DUF3168 domain-containing protein [Tateyamaria sp. syn59]|uniref:tail completion protein gp17 n=1 Tax=Tateyamaria sp. syn59 TaxID=2576942 RepID=UPI0011BDAFE7|nr:DUF3168 domain-containing protein [Tateyamaria sp. syn59]
MKDALTAMFLADARLNALVQGRVHWGKQPAQVEGRPYLNLTVISDPRTYHMKGRSALRRTRVQVDAWAALYDDADAAETAISALDEASATVRDGIRFQGIFVAGSRDVTDEGVDGETLFRASVDLDIHWNEETNQ